MNTRLINAAIAFALAATSFSATAGEFGGAGLKKRTLNERGIIIVGGKSPGDAVSLNPQPLPPKVFSGIGGIGDQVALNPQPLPPRTWRRR